MVFFLWRGFSTPLEWGFLFFDGASPVLFYYLDFRFSVLYRRALPRTPLPRRLTPFGRGRDPGNLVPALLGSPVQMKKGHHRLPFRWRILLVNSDGPNAPRNGSCQFRHAVQLRARPCASELTMPL